MVGPIALSGTKLKTPTCLFGLVEDDGNGGVGGEAEDEDEHQVDYISL